MAKRDKQSKLDKLGKIAQIMQLLGMSGERAADRAQQGQGQGIQAALAMLGLMQGDKNAAADRGLRERQMTSDDVYRTATMGREDARFEKDFGFREGRAKSEDERFNKDFGFREGRAKVEDTMNTRKQDFVENSTTEQVMQAWQRLGQEKDLAERGLDLRGKEVGLQEKGQRLAVARDAMTLPNAKLGDLFKFMGQVDPGLAPLGEYGAAEAKAKQDALNQLLNASKATQENEAVASNFWGGVAMPQTAIPGAHFGAELAKMLVTPDPVNMTDDFLPPGMRPSIPTNFSAALPPGLMPIADPKTSPLLNKKLDVNKFLNSTF